MQKWGGLRALKVMGNATIRQSAYDVLLDFNRNYMYVSILYRFRHIASYLYKVADFNLLHLHLAPPPGLTVVEFRGDFSHEKTRVPELSCGFACVILFSRFGRIPTCDRHRAIAYTALAQRCAVKKIFSSLVAISLVGTISGKSQKLLPPGVILKLKCTIFDFGWGSAPDPAWGAYSAPQSPSWI